VNLCATFAKGQGGGGEDDRCGVLVRAISFDSMYGPKYCIPDKKQSVADLTPQQAIGELGSSGMARRSAVSMPGNTQRNCPFLIDTKAIRNSSNSRRISANPVSNRHALEGL
jgi:hypothetical protein